MSLPTGLHNLTPALTDFDAGDSFNARQRQVLREYGATCPEELTLPISRLAFANAAAVPTRIDPLTAHRPVIDPVKIEAARLSPTRRLELAEDADMIARTRLEKENATSVRSTTDAECAAALARLQPFLADRN